MTTALRMALVSDLHLGAGPVSTVCHSPWGDLFDSDEEFDAFASWLGGTDTSRIVLLGDTIDFHRVRVADAPVARRAEDALDQLNRVAHAHPVFFRALARLLDAGLNVDVVVGNHDVELALPEVQQRFAALLGLPRWSPATPDQALRFHTWFLYVPGLLYAEHGNHYHDINSFERPLQPFIDNRVERPLAARLNSARLLLTAQAECRPPRLALMADLARGPRVSRRLRHAYLHRVVPRHAEQVGLPAVVVAALHRLGSASACSMARRIFMLRVLHSDRHAFRSHAPRMAAAILELLQAAGHAVPYCVFGHTHAAVGLDGDRREGYLNCGTWASGSPGRSGPHGGMPSLYRTWIEVVRGSSGETSAGLWQWRDGPASPRQSPDQDGVGREPESLLGPSTE